MLRMSGDRCVPVGWFPAPAATITGSHHLSSFQVQNHLPWFAWPPVSIPILMEFSSPTGPSLSRDKHLVRLRHRSSPGRLPLLGHFGYSKHRAPAFCSKACMQKHDRSGSSYPLCPNATSLTEACRRPALRGGHYLSRCSRGAGGHEECYLVDPASSHMLVSKIKPCMCKYELIQTVKLRMAH